MIRVAPLLVFIACVGAADSLAPVTLVSGRLSDPALGECSGVVASRAYGGVIWAHNDSGNPAELFAIGVDGTTIARFAVAAANVDWEDIAIDDAGILIADVGNNRRDRLEVQVLRVDEPDPALPAVGPLPVRATWRLTWPDQPADCEALLVAGAIGYLIDKRLDGPPGVWRFRLDHLAPQVLERVATLPINAPVTGADLSLDGRRLAVCHPLGLHVFALPPGDFAAVVATAPRSYLGWLDPHQEACCFVPGGVLAISESRTIRWCSDQRLAAGGGEFPAPVTIDLHPTPTAYVLDGEIGEWGAANALTLSTSAGPGSVRVWVAWSANGVVVAGEVTGAAPTAESRPWYVGDVAEFFLGEERPQRPPEYGPGDDRCYLAVDPRGGLALRWPRRSIPPAGTRSAGRVLADGYRFEAFLPTSAALSADGAVRFAVSVLTRTPRRNWYLPLANDAGVWLSPLTWAVARLAP